MADFESYGGNKIDEAKISEIKKDKTTGKEIVMWFGSPVKTSKLGDDELYTYQYIKNRVTSESSGASRPVKASSAQLVNELIIIIDKKGIVKDFKYTKMF